MPIEASESAAADDAPDALPLRIELEYAERVNLAMQQNGVALVERISLTNTSDHAIDSISVTVSLENAECEPWTGRIERIDPRSTHNLEPTDLALSATRMAGRTEAIRTTLLIEAAAAIASTSKRVPIELLAFDDWPGVGFYPELLAAFITPNHPLIAEMLGAARQSMRAHKTSDALDGYQSGSRQRAALLAEACFHALHACGFGYISAPASFENNGQRVRLVDRVSREQLGSCLDLSLLLAGLWEQVGLHPLVLLVEGHAMPAVWTRETHLPEPAIEDPARVRNLIELGEIVPVESTLVTHANATFAEAVNAARQKLDAPGKVFCAVDVRSARKLGVRPLPLRTGGAETQVDVDALRTLDSPAIAGTSLDRVALADRTEGAAASDASKEELETGMDRVERWRAKLLDLSLRNRLISFRESGRTLRLNVPDVARLEDMLASDTRFSINARTDGDVSFIKQELEEANLYPFDTAIETQKRLLMLSRLARQSIEETGANILHLAIGMLKWFESDTSDTPRLAPLILLPVQLDRRSTGVGYHYTLSLSEEPIRPNVTLLEKLRKEFHIDTEGLEDFPEDDNGIDVPAVLRAFRHAIRDTARWEVEESAYLGLFSFNKFLMWRDLRENIDRLRQNRLVAHLVDREQKVFDPNPFPRADDLDDTVKPEDVFCTRDADSSQMAAIRAAAEGRTFVLEGPPGTGKSQTIANIIADSIGRGKRVLFVAEKMAALSVVSRRLAEDGLRPFCLELHSARASKKDVLAQLNEALDVSASGEPADWDQVCRDVGVTRHQLNTYVRELHERRDTGESLYRVLGRMCTLGEGSRGALPTDDVAKVKKEQLETWREQLTRIEAVAEAVDPIYEHSLRGIGRSDWDFELTDKIRAAIDQGMAIIQQLRDCLVAFLNSIGATQIDAAKLNRDAVHVVSVFASWLPQCPAPHIDLLAGANAPRLIATLLPLVAVGRLRDEQRNSLLARYAPAFLDVDTKAGLQRINAALAMSPPLTWISGFFARRKFKSYCIGKLPKLATLKGDLEAAGKQKELNAKLAPLADAAPMLEDAWSDDAPQWDTIERTLKWCQQFHQAVEILRNLPSGDALIQALATAASQPSTPRSAATEAKALVAVWKQWNECWRDIKRTLATSSEAAFGDAHIENWLNEAKSVFKRWLDGLPELNDWCMWRRARDEAASAGLSGLLEQLEHGEINRTALRDAFERSFGEKWFNTIASSVDAIRNFNAGSHTKTIERFRQIDQQLIGRTRYAVTAALSKSMPSVSSHASSQSELGILKREIEKKTRHLPTRRLVEAIPNLLPRLKPCFLMSPLSIAQYLDPKQPPFDLVVFDEASQIPVWDAIGAIARGTEVIVVGDSKQLPPTNFFNVAESEDDHEMLTDEYFVEDMDSILKECRAAMIPPLDLKWHYRSRHESLIAFSNFHYYDNKLHTFPSPEERSAKLGVTFRHVADGVYDRGKSRTNRAEANQVVDEIVRLLREENPDSIGVVTFNLSQQGLIEDLLDAKRREMPEIEKYFTNESREPVFVKNLESVQGDERDTIIFSVGFGPDDTGKITMNFGPLNQEGGERRLNVAVTRARKRLMVFSSLRSDQIDLRKTRATGVKHFKTFLDYADRGPQAIAEATEHSDVLSFDSSFERTVWQSLTDKGFEVDTQVGCAGYRVDLAIRDPDRPGHYLLGVECDGAAYHSGKTARDRDRIRQAVLESLHWRIARVWSTDWWINRDRCLARLLEAIEHAKTNGGVTSSEAEPAADELVRFESTARVATIAPSVDSKLIRYQCTKLKDRSLARYDFFEIEATAPAMQCLVDIVAAEAPIMEELAMRRLAAWFDKRVTDRFRTRFDLIRSNAIKSQRIKSIDGVFWPADRNENSYTDFRVPGPHPDDERDLELIPLIERANAVVHVVHEQYGLPREELEREAARVLGASRLTAKAKELIGDAVELAIASGRTHVEGDRISIPPSA